MRRSITKTLKLHAPLRGVQVRTRVTAPVATKRELSPGQTVAPAAAVKPKDDLGRLEKLMLSIGEGINELGEAQAQNLQELREVSIELGVAIAAHLLRTKLDANEYNLQSLVSEAIERLTADDKLSLTVNPADLADLKGLLAGPLQQFSEQVDLIEDSTIPRGGCFLGAKEHGLFTSFESRLENVRETLLQGIQYARLERRKAVDLDRTLRRFPDRRKLA